jgi:hypothetical protein
VITSDVAPPPISGGTLLVSNDGLTALASDPDRDRIVVVDLQKNEVRSVIQMPPGSEPGRAADDRDGRAYVALRTSGKVVIIDLASGKEVGSMNVCPAPRGIAVDSVHHELHVACAGGELVTIGLGAVPIVHRIARLGDDLRDVVVSGNKLFVSHFRSSSLDVVDTAGKLVHENRPGRPTLNGVEFSPTVAWRTIGLPDGRVVVIHQQSMLDPVIVPKSESIPNGGTSSSTGGGEGFPGGSPYGGSGSDCTSGIVHSEVSMFDAAGDPLDAFGGGSLAGMMLPVDIAASLSGDRLAIVSAGNKLVIEGPPDVLTQTDGCSFGFPGTIAPTPTEPAISLGIEGTRAMPTYGEPIAVAYGRRGELLVQSREPAMLEIHDVSTGAVLTTIGFGGASRFDTGHALFHGNPDDQFVTVSCASCHPEGRDDGHTWTFSDVGARRTQSLSSFSNDTAPFHWGGDLADVGAVMDEVFVQRMGNQPQTPSRKNAIANWMSHIPSAPGKSGIDAASAERGRVLFEDAVVGCSSCHGGSRFTNNATIDVGTGLALQVPSLVGVRGRAPFMHDGCAATLRDRFAPLCGGGDTHGQTSQLAAGEIDDLVSYLETL